MLSCLCLESFVYRSCKAFLGLFVKQKGNKERDLENSKSNALIDSSNRVKTK